MKSIMNHSFSNVPKVQIPRSVFDRTHTHKTTFDADYLIPFYADEALPGDTFKLDASVFARLATPIAPIMDNMVMETFYFAVPNRLLWENWERFNGAQDNPEASTDYLVPTTAPESASGGFLPGSIYDYFGVPVNIEEMEINSLHLRAYMMIWNEWFRDQNLQPADPVQKGDGPDDPDTYYLKKVNKRHDYFTSCLPWPQKGDAVSIGLAGDAPVIGDGYAIGLIDSTTGGATQTDVKGLKRDTNSQLTAWYSYRDFAVGTSPGGDVDQLDHNVAVGLSLNPAYSGMYADLDGVSATTINELRQAFQIQKMLEKDARGGTRYTEILKSHFGVTSPDFRLQRPEYLGGSKTKIIINPVAQTSSTDVETPQGNLAGYGIAADRGRGFTKSFTEHCVIIGLVCVRADLTYQQGLNKMWSRQTRYDFYWPSFAHLGEQAVLGKEIYCAGDAGDEEVFGYQERYAEYRYKPSLITGQFRSNFPTSLDLWHLSEQFTSRPLLNNTFIQSSTPVDRVIAVPTEPHFLFDSYISLKSARPMPTYSVPGLIDHF